MIKKINEILGVKEAYQAPDKLLEIVLDNKSAFEVYHEMLEAHNYDLSYDWFHKYFQEEHADRKNKKQDFTPVCIATLLHQSFEQYDGILYEPSCGTGGIIIQHWKQVREYYGFLRLNPMERIYICEELSERTIPFLLFNLAIRGVNAIVIQNNVITREAVAFYHVFNEKNNHMNFSSIIKLDPVFARRILEKTIGLTFRIGVEEIGIQHSLY